jgi:uncharacterized protein involved in propanediol utilization
MAFVAGHFGEWLQGRAGPSGEIALVTLACPVRGASVTWETAPGLVVSDPSAVIGKARAAAFLSALGQPARGRIEVRSDLPPGGGAGMSTAALVALARAAGAAEAEIAVACLAVEGAVDPLMHPRPDALLWASRSARLLAEMPAPPRATVVGGFWGPPERTDPADSRFPPVDDLIEAWARGPDLPEAARLAQQSAERSTALRGPADDPTPALAARTGALGWARAHTGPARALIFPPEAATDGARAALTAAGYTHVLRFATGGRA